MPKKIPDINAELVRAMREPSEKWDFIVKILNQEKEELQWSILNKKTTDGKDLNKTQIFDLITWWEFLDYVATLPEVILEESKPRPKPKPHNFETYDLPKPLKGVRDQINENINDED